jgi:SNF2 family DNA or RNA helicase
VSFVELNIDEEKRQFIIHGDISLIVANRRAKYYFLDVLHAVINGTAVVIDYIETDKESVLQDIQNALEKYNIEQKDSERIKSVLSGYFEEKRNFEIFGQKAKDIWNNKISTTEFQEFKQAVETRLKGRSLYDKQLLASFHLAFSQHACNFSVPGAGKTSIVYAAYSYLNSLSSDHPKYVNKILVIGPLSSFGPWEDEFYMCFGKTPHSVRLSGGMPKEDRDRHLLSIKPVEETPELTLMSYQSVPNNISSLLYYLQRNGNKVMVILDEAHRIKNIDGGVWAQATLDIARHCKSRVVLTGTPLPNGYEDIYNLFEFIWPGKDVIGYSVSQLKDMSKNRFDPRINQLIENISPYFVRIRKSHLNLPPAINQEPNFIEMGETQREIYDFIEKKYLSYFISNETILSLSSELTKARFIRLMQAATNPNLLKTPLEAYFKEQGLGDELHIDDTEIIQKILRFTEYEKAPQKFVAIKDIVSKLLAQNEKVVIWTTFIQNTKELQGYLKDFGIESRLLIGEVPVERDDLSAEDILTREKIIREFHDPNSSFKVIIANPFAVSESISLHKACHHAIYLERTFNATHFIQSKDRIHRVGLDPKTETHYYYILSKNSIDETVHHRLQEKEQRMLEIIENEEIPLFSENMDYEIDLNNDIKAIIRDYVRRITKI